MEPEVAARRIPRKWSVALVGLAVLFSLSACETRSEPKADPSLRLGWSQKFIGPVKDEAPPSAESAGDLNGDGIEDLLFQSEATAWVVFGSRNDRTVKLDEHLEGNGFLIEGPIDRDGVEPAGDVNGDGIDDLIIAGRAGYPDHSNIAIAFVVLGKRGLSRVNLFEMFQDDATTSGYRIFSPWDSPPVSRSVSEGGDVNGDGLDDVVVGIGDNSSAYVLFGSESHDDVFLERFESKHAQGGYVIRTWFLEGASLAGDINGDGLSDTLVHSYSDHDNPRTRVVFGKKDTTPVHAGRIGSWGFQVHQGAYIGYATFASGGGDVNGDGKDDLVLTMFGEDEPGTVYVVFGANRTVPVVLSDLDERGFRIVGPLWEESGFAADAIFSGDGDRFSDILIGAPRLDIGGEDTGTYYVISGSRAPVDLDEDDLEGTFQKVGYRDGLNLGRGLTPLQDLNGDGLMELLVTAGNADDAHAPLFLFLSE